MTTEGNVDFSKELSRIITNYFVPFLCIGAIILVIVIGIRFGMARDAKQREEAKKRLMSMMAVTMIFMVISGILFAANIAGNLNNANSRLVANGTYLIIVEATGISGKRFTYSARIGVSR